jgi:hypothetical protein
MVAARRQIPMAANTSVPRRRPALGVKGHGGWSTCDQICDRKSWQVVDRIATHETVETGPQSGSLDAGDAD